MTPDEFSALTRAQEELRAQRDEPLPPPRDYKKRKSSLASNITLDLKKSDMATILESRITETSTTRRLTVSANRLRSRSIISKVSAKSQVSRSQKP